VPYKDEHLETEAVMSSPVAVPLQLTLDAVLHPDPDGGYTAEVPALPGCYSEGDTLESAVANIREAAAAWLAAAHDHATRNPHQGAA
jgi:predicted RNase H-like HicB family nuclease